MSLVLGVPKRKFGLLQPLLTIRETKLINDCLCERIANRSLLRKSPWWRFPVSLYYLGRLDLVAILKK